MLNCLGGSNVITRVHKNGKGNLKRGPEKWQCEKDWAQNCWPWRWKEATAKECWWPLKAEKDKKQNKQTKNTPESLENLQKVYSPANTLLLAQWHPFWISDPQNYDDVVQSLSHIPLFEILCTAACQASLSFSISQSLFKFMSTELVMLSNHLILCCTLLLLPSIIPSSQVFPNESALHIMWPKY